MAGRNFSVVLDAADVTIKMLTGCACHVSKTPVAGR
jgi:hypothetical protein